MSDDWNETVAWAGQNGGEEALLVYFLPFTMGLHHCCIAFEDSECGSFMYEITGHGRLPSPARPFTFQVVPSSLPPCPPLHPLRSNHTTVFCTFQVLSAFSANSPHSPPTTCASDP